MRTLKSTNPIMAVAATLALALSACAGGSSAEPTTNATAAVATDEVTTDATEDITGEITVLAAASLTESFTELAEQFMADNEGTTINLSFGSSSALALTVSEGSPVDLLATADLTSMDVAVDGLDDADPVVFAGNDLVIAVAQGNPNGIEGLEQLVQSDLLISRCAAEVPCGRLTTAALEAGNLTMNAVTEGADVKATFAPLVTGEVDSALVYRTDAMASADVDLVEIESPFAQQTQYPLAVLSNSILAQAFYDYLVSESGNDVLDKHGFTQP